ncbi:hypothetical protein PF005_g8146 [Phytophthora fragariae]|uniref:Uncharacterized protein n=1 Tax=Phytophthora fragariae TaxID=53985 RepID=A0A6A3YI46_9STRA|nr:hypothetical protein PF009_g9341 [Phytophthora fragariae]KAE9007849.1 hypothetical protein PF011_g10950 [Phytophthora fragariae]KAE9121068.1 hypothetical protein PF010_g7245 [Phytophthora fragariae]KAE9149807.1 hypothetical protein PF006_g5747 [Phytophthora fragariae]KAE9218742.1 hypothetical protein PF005_g8146 [Phytophthora fragariae]
MSDFSVTAPAASVPVLWAELGSATRSFMDFSRAIFDTTTTSVA